MATWAMMLIGGGAAILGLRSALPHLRQATSRWAATSRFASTSSSANGRASAAGAAAGEAAAAGGGAAGSSEPLRAPDLNATGIGGAFGKRFYDGGFDEKMSKREAALILGVRETSSKDRVMERYRILMKLNHPDLGGSPFLAGKINEAKDVLGKTARNEEKPGK